MNDSPSHPSVSVVIPTYNRARYVKKAIESVLAQTFTDYEIIVIDDGSTDNTKDLLQPFFSKIIYIFQENKGVSAARNVGIIAAKGEWIAFLDSDDEWDRRKLKKQLKFNLENKLDVSFTNFVFNRGEENILNDLIEKPLILFLMRNEKLWLPTMLIRKELIQFFDETLIVSEDIKMFYNLANRTRLWGYIGIPLVSITRDNSISSLTNDSSPAILYKKSYNAFLVHYQALCLNRFAERGILNVIKKHMNHHLFNTAKRSYHLYGYRKSILLMVHSLISSVSLVTFIKSVVLLIFPFFYLYNESIHSKKTGVKSGKNRSNLSGHLG